MGKVKILGRIVIVTGPVSTGRSWLAYKMMQAHNNESCVTVQFCRANPNNATMLDALLRAQKKIEDSLMSNTFTIISTKRMTYESLRALIVSLRVMGYKDKITVVKMNLSEELHMDFWRRNHDKAKISLNKLRRERANFEAILADNNFGDKDVISVKIDNPDDVSFEFCD